MPDAKGKRIIPSPDRCFGPDREVDGSIWDEYQYENFVIDNQNPDYHG